MLDECLVDADTMFSLSKRCFNKFCQINVGLWKACINLRFTNLTTIFIIKAIKMKYCLDKVDDILDAIVEIMPIIRDYGVVPFARHKPYYYFYY